MAEVMVDKRAAFWIVLLLVTYMIVVTHGIHGIIDGR